MVWTHLDVAAAQPPCMRYDVASNAAAHATAIRSAGARVVVFPELSLTGYELDAPAITAGDPRLAPIIEACAVTGSLALAGAPVQDEADRRIATLAVDGTGARVAYRKMYLGTAEAVRFTAGTQSAVLDVDGWRLGLAICKDIGVPEHAAGTAALGIDAYVAGTLEPASRSALQDERARRVAAGRRVWVVVASFAGSAGEPGGEFAQAAGRSAIWDPAGAEVARAGSLPGGIARATLRPVHRLTSVTEARLRVMTNPEGQCD